MRRKAFVCVSMVLLSLAGTRGLSAADPAGEILTLSGVKGGLCVQLGCRDEELIASVGRTGRFLGHGIFLDAKNAARAGNRLAEQGLAGIATAEHLPLSPLPYADNLVNLLVADDLPALMDKGLLLGELLRVQRPGGVACLGVPPGKRATIEAQVKKAGIRDYRFEKKSRLWLVIDKARPKEMDEWTHFNHGPDGNLVSRDTLIERPNRLQWIAGPQWGDARAKTPGNGNPFGMISAGGQNYYLEGRRARFSKGSHELVARDAFNGIMLWSKRIALGWPQIVAAGNEVYLKQGDEILALDGRTGERLRTYGKADGCKRLILADGILLSISSKKIRAFAADSAKQKWASGDIPVRTPVVDQGKIFVSGLTCLDLASGTKRWHKEIRGNILFARDGMLLLRAGEGKGKSRGYRYRAVSAEDGRELWSLARPRPPGAKSGIEPEAYLAGGLVWIQSPHDRSKRKNDGFHNKKGGVSYKWEGLDPKSGKIVRDFLAPVQLPYRCHHLYATDRFNIANRPLYFTNWQSGEVSRFDGTRAACQGGHGLANGMFYGWYTANKLCMCIRDAIGGVTAFTSDRKTIDGHVQEEAEGRLQKGTAALPESAQKTGKNDWPTYRSDMKRSASTPGLIQSKAMSMRWKQRLLPDGTAPSSDAAKGTISHDWLLSGVGHEAISAPTAAAGRVFVSLNHAQEVAAVDEKSGKVAWRYRVSGRLDAPPTYYNGLCLVGSHDGWVYCLRANDGELVWRFRAAPVDRRIVAFGQLESAWPVVGGVLIANDLAYVIAGRTTEADGGLYVHALDPKTGNVVWSGRRVKPDDGAIGAWNLRSEGKTYTGPGDLLGSDGQTLAIGGWRAGRFECKSGREVSNHAFRGPGFRWMQSRYYSNRRGQYSQIAYSDNKQVTDARLKSGTYSIKMPGKDGWNTALPVSTRPQALAISGTLKDAAATVLATLTGKSGGALWILSAGNGAILAKHELPAAPAWEGLAVSGHRIYVTLKDGTLVCFGKQ